MSRRRAAEKRTILPDHKFKDIVLAKFMNRIMVDGKKSKSEKIVYGAFDLVSKKTDKEPIDFFHEALNNVKPSLEVRSRRVGGATYQVPMEVRPKRAQTLAMKWIVDSALKRNVNLEELGNTALYFVSDLSKSVTGEIHYVDCGFNIIGMPSTNT